MTQMTINSTLITDIMNTYLEMGGSYFDMEDVEGFIHEVLESGLEYDDNAQLIELVADHMIGEE